MSFSSSTDGLPCVDCGKSRRPRKSGEIRLRCHSCAMKKLRREQPRYKPSHIHRLVDVVAAWLGAMVEGEGSITIRQSRKRGFDGIQIVVASTEVETIATCLRLSGGGHVQPQFRSRRNGRLGDRTMWYWIVTRHNEVTDFLPQIIPYLTGKREKAEEALRLLGIKR